MTKDAMTDKPGYQERMHLLQKEMMGRYYAEAQGENEAVAHAIEDHYKPKGPDDLVPAEPVSIAVALADKLDTIAGIVGNQTLGSSVEITGKGTISIGADGSYSFTPAAGYSGPVPTIWAPTWSWQNSFGSLEDRRMPLRSARKWLAWHRTARLRTKLLPLSS